ncbi:hypothetical protein EVAR_67323_1 [Eumeta japonica]|uniref:Uncharacterized protein n=1 Tax=Eumeta variegata TaxID=151549 RepID=A0A4C1ZDU7_EUMVA|nr:hypothetical protein EVAR_67323_1 [Eumeta japonica]
MILTSRNKYVKVRTWRVVGERISSDTSEHGAAEVGAGRQSTYRACHRRRVIFIAAYWEKSRAFIVRIAQGKLGDDIRQRQLGSVRAHTTPTPPPKGRRAALLHILGFRVFRAPTTTRVHRLVVVNINIILEIMHQLKFILNLECSYVAHTYLYLSFSKVFHPNTE